MISTDPLSVLMRGIQARHLDWGAGAETIQPGDEAFARFFGDGTARPAAGAPAAAGAEGCGTVGDPAAAAPAEAAAPLGAEAAIAGSKAAVSGSEAVAAGPDTALAGPDAALAGPDPARAARDDGIFAADEVRPEHVDVEPADPNAGPLGAVPAAPTVAAQAPAHAPGLLQGVSVKKSAQVEAGAVEPNESESRETKSGLRVDSFRPGAEPARAPAAVAESASAPDAPAQEAFRSPEAPPEDVARPQRSPQPAVALASAPISQAAGPPAPIVELVSAPAALSPAPGAPELGWSLSAGSVSGGASSVREAAATAAGVPAGPASAVTGQVATAIRAGDGDRVEIRLDPPELGRVQIEMRVVEGALHAIVVAERPEVSDLLRRHAEMLQRDLEAAGYGDVSLDFAAGGQDGSERRNQPRGGARPLDILALAAAPSQSARVAGDSRLDIRL